MDFWGNILSGAAGGLLGVVSTFYSTRQAQRRYTDQTLEDFRKELKQELETNDAILEWYYSQFLELRSYLFGETELVQELHDTVSSPPSPDYYEFLLKSVNYQNFCIFDSAERPDFLDKELVIEFSKIGDAGVRGKILNFGIRLSREYEILARTLYKFQRFLEFKIDGSNRGDGIDDTLKSFVYMRALIISLIFNAIHDILSDNPWNNEFIEHEQREREKRAFTILSSICSDVTVPERLKDISELDIEKEKLDRKFNGGKRIMLDKIFRRKASGEKPEQENTRNRDRKENTEKSNLQKMDELTDRLEELTATIPLR